MPRKRRVALLAHRQLTWDDVDVRAMLDFWVGWHPPVGEFERSRSHWPTWEEYLSHWAAVRADALPEWQAKRAEMRGHYCAEVARRAEQLERAVTESDRELWERLIAEAEENLAKEESKELPFAEIAYQRVLSGKVPDDSDDDEDDRTSEGS